MSETPEAPKAPPESKATPAEPEKEQKQPFDKAKAEKFGFIDFESLTADVRKAVEPRFKRLYSDFKTTERALKELRDVNTAVMAKLDRIESTSTSERITNHLATIKAAIKTAADEGDISKVVALTDTLTDWKVKIATAQKPSPAVKKEPQPEPEHETGRQLSKNETGVVNDWINEQDDDGRALRPWAQDGHRLQQKAIKMVHAVLADEEYRDADIAEVLGEVDRLMDRGGGPVKRSAAAVLDPDSGPSRSKGRVAPLSDDEKRVAERMYGGKPHEAHEKYRRAKALVKET